MAVVVPIVSTFDAKGIKRAISDFKKLEGAGNKATYGITSLQRATSNGLRNVAKFGGIASAAIGVVGFQLVKGAEFAKQADDRLVAVARSMDLFGASADAVAQRLQKLADAQEYELGVTAETIKMTQAKLLTFKNIALTAGEVGGAFDRATTAAIDLGAAGFGEASQNAVQLGKALQDPIKGITALARSGVTFTASEKEKIKALVQSGQLLKAQDTLLKAIETQVGGTAAATVTDTFKIAAAFGHIRDEIGTLLLPIVERFADFMVKKVVPFATEAGKVFGEKGFGGGVGFLVGKLDDFIQSGNKVVDIMLAFGTALAILKGITIAATIAQVAFNTALFANPIGIVVAAIIAIGVALVAAYIRFEGFRKVVNFVINAVIGYFEFMANVWIGAINLVIKGVNLFGGILRAVGIKMPELGEIGKVAFGRIGDAAAGATKEVVGLQAETERFARLNPKNRVKPNLGGGDDDEGDGPTGGAAKAVETVQEKIKKYTDALKGLTSQQKNLTSATEGTVKAQRDLGNATEGVRIAQAQFNIVTQGYSRDSRKAQEATRGLEDANRRLRDATLGQEEAVRRVGQAEKALAQLRAIAADPESVEAAERNLTRSKFDQEESAFAVIEAEKQLAELRASPEANPMEIRRAEIALQEAKFRVTEATLGIRDAEEKLRGEREKAASAEELAEAERDLDAAKRGVEDAIRDTQDATSAQAEAQEHLNEILHGAREGSDAYREALDELNEAKKREQEAIDAVAEAFSRERDALLELIEAQKELNRIRSLTPPAVIARAERILGAQAALGLPSQAAVAAAAAAAAVGGAAPAFGITPFAKGGIVMRPTMGLVGEAGPEAIIPLRNAGALGGEINITVNAGMGANGPEIGDAIVEALRKWQFRNGALVGSAQPLKVA
jgi:hypothetical protein